MNAPYDGDRDSAGQMPPSPEQRPAPADPYLQNTYAFDPYQQQQDQAQWQQQPGYQQPHPDNAATQYMGTGGAAGNPGQEQQGQEYDAFDHLYRDQQPQGGQQDGQQGGYQQQSPPQQDGGHQQYPQQEGYAPQDGSPQGGYPQQGGGYQGGYQGGGYQAAYQHMPSA